MIRLSSIYTPLHVVQTGNWPFDTLEEHVQRHRLAIPDYQRGHAWSDEQASLFVGHALSGGPMLPLIINQHTYERINKPLELVDGLQRMTAMRRFMKNEIPAKIENLVFYFHDTDRQFRLTMGFVVQFVALTRIEALRFYKRFNTGGTPHSRAAIERVDRMIEDEERK